RRYVRQSSAFGRVHRRQGSETAARRAGPRAVQQWSSHDHHRDGRDRGGVPVRRVRGDGQQRLRYRREQRESRHRLPTGGLKTFLSDPSTTGKWVNVDQGTGSNQTKGFLDTSSHLADYATNTPAKINSLGQLSVSATGSVTANVAPPSS